MPVNRLERAQNYVIDFLKTHRAQAEEWQERVWNFEGVKEAIGLDGDLPREWGKRNRPGLV